MHTEHLACSACQHLDLLAWGECDKHEGTEAAMGFRSHGRLQLAEEEEWGKSATWGRVTGDTLPCTVRAKCFSADPAGFSATHV